MTFDQWWEANRHKFPQADYSADGHKEVAKAAWDYRQAEIDSLMLSATKDEK